MKLVYPPLNLPADWLTAWISRPDDPSAKWNAEDLEWLPANEWLSVNNFSVRLSPLEERELLLPIMPAREIPVQIHIQVQAHLRLPAEKATPTFGVWFPIAAMVRLGSVGRDRESGPKRTISIYARATRAHFEIADGIHPPQLSHRTHLRVGLLL